MYNENGMYLDFTYDIGFANEAKVETALKIIQKEQRYGLASLIKGFIWAQRHSRLDRNHVDFLVSLEGGIEVPLQVKSSERKRKKFEKFCKSLGLSISVIVVHIGESLESVIEQVVEKIKLALNSVQRQMNRIAFLNKMREKKRQRKQQQKFSRVHAPCMCH
jgi:hypothetical protein